MERRGVIGRVVSHRGVEHEFVVVADRTDRQRLRFTATSGDSGQRDRAGTGVFQDGDVGGQIECRLIVHGGDVHREVLGDHTSDAVNCRRIFHRDGDRRGPGRIGDRLDNDAAGRLALNVAHRLDRHFTECIADGGHLQHLIFERSRRDASQTDRAARRIFQQDERRELVVQRRVVVDGIDGDSERFRDRRFVARIEAEIRPLIFDRDLNRGRPRFVRGQVIGHAPHRSRGRSEEHRRILDQARRIAEDRHGNFDSFRARIAVADPGERYGLRAERVFRDGGRICDVVDGRRIDHEDREGPIKRQSNVVGHTHGDRRRAAHVGGVEGQRVGRGGSGQRGRCHCQTGEDSVRITRALDRDSDGCGLKRAGGNAGQIHGPKSRCPDFEDTVRDDAHDRIVVVTLRDHDTEWHVREVAGGIGDPHRDRERTGGVLRRSERQRPSRIGGRIGHDRIGNRCRVAARRGHGQSLRLVASGRDPRQADHLRSGNRREGRLREIDGRDRINRRWQIHIGDRQQEHLGDGRTHAVGNDNRDVRGPELIGRRVEDQCGHLQSSRGRNSALCEIHGGVRYQRRVVAGGSDRDGLSVEVSVRDAVQRHRVNHIPALVDRRRRWQCQCRRISAVRHIDDHILEERFVTARTASGRQHAIEACVFDGHSDDGCPKQIGTRSELERAGGILRRVRGRKIRDQSRDRTAEHGRGDFENLRFPASGVDPRETHCLLTGLFRNRHRSDRADFRLVVHGGDVDHNRLVCEAVVRERVELAIQAGVHDLHGQCRGSEFIGDRLIGDDRAAAACDSQSWFGEAHRRIGDERGVVAGHGDRDLFLSRQGQRLERPRVNAGQADRRGYRVFQDVDRRHRRVDSRSVIDGLHSDVERA